MRAILLIILMVSSQFPGISQGQDLAALLEGIEGEKDRDATEVIAGTFKSSRVINLHSVEIGAPGALDFRIAHRFGALDGGGYEFFGLDQATMRLALEYSFNKALMVGFGRSTYQKTFDGFIKAKLVKQTKGKKTTPLSIVYFTSATINSLHFTDTSRTNYFTSRMAYVHQVIFARKFSSKFSFQFSPTLVHKNLVPSTADQNTSYALGLSGRFMLSKRTSFNAEYIYRIPPPELSPAFESNFNSLSIGIDIETGGHVFSLHFSNSAPMIEKGFITETNKQWNKGGVHFGFNISRQFYTRKKE